MNTSLKNSIGSIPAFSQPSVKHSGRNLYGTVLLTALVLTYATAQASTVGFWQMEGTAGTTATGTNTILDYSGHGLNASPVPLSSGGPTYSSDVSPTAANLGSTSSLLFNGHSQQVFVPDYAAFQLTNSLTIEAWIKPLSPNQTGANVGNILFRGDNRVGLDPYFLDVNTAGQLQFGVDSSTSSVLLNANITFGQWMHVAGTLDGTSGAMKLYVNGVLVNSTTTTVRPLAQLDPNSEPGVGIGADQDTQYAELFNGWIDDVRLSDAALQPSQMLIPEPSSLSLIGMGVGAVVLLRKRAQQ